MLLFARQDVIRGTVGKVVPNNQLQTQPTDGVDCRFRLTGTSVVDCWVASAVALSELRSSSSNIVVTPAPEPILNVSSTTTLPAPEVVYVKSPLLGAEIVEPVIVMSPSDFNVSAYPRLVHAVDPSPILNLLVSDSHPNSPAAIVGLLDVQSAAVSLLNCICVGIILLCLRLLL